MGLISQTANHNKQVTSTSNVTKAVGNLNLSAK